MNLDFCVQSRLLQIHSCLLHNLVLKAAYLHSSVVMEQIIVLLVNHNQNPTSAPLLNVEVETLTPSWAFFDAPAHRTSTPT